jgi:two-component system, cell cycle response regulator DivK
MPAYEPARRCILIIEDDALNQKLIREVLDFHGYTTLVTGIPEAGIDMALAHRPDLILLDIMLPGLSGIDVARLLKGDDETKAIPIIAVTALAMPGDRQRILQSGCDAYLAKPLHIRELIELVAALSQQQP